MIRVIATGHANIRDRDASKEMKASTIETDMGPDKAIAQLIEHQRANLFWISPALVKESGYGKSRACGKYQASDQPLPPNHRLPRHPAS
jgi:hypothetical protein